MTVLLDGAGRFFNPSPSIRVMPIAKDRICLIVDDALANPQGLIDWAAGQSFDPPPGYSYPGLVCAVPEAITESVADYFALHARSLIGARRTQNTELRLSLLTAHPSELAPVQWQCHRDRLAVEPDKMIYAASVLYLFGNPALGGTSFYQPLLSAAQTERMLADSKVLATDKFGARYGLEAGYMVDSNRYFERVASVPAAWNRMIFYDGGLFHSADIRDPSVLSQDARAGRLTLNGFFACTRKLVPNTYAVVP